MNQIMIITLVKQDMNVESKNNNDCLKKGKNGNPSKCRWLSIKPSGECLGGVNYNDKYYRYNSQKDDYKNPKEPILCKNVTDENMY